MHPKLSREAVLKHYGVKGMKWGVRNDKGHEGESAKTKKIAKLDKKFERNSSTLSTMLKIHNAAAAQTNKNDVDRINNKPEYKDADFNKPSKLRDKYYKEHEDAFIANLDKAAADYGTNASGTKKYAIAVRDDGTWKVALQDVKHSDGSDPVEMIVRVHKDAKGFITSLEVLDPEENVLAHYGVKGMKWGVQRNRTPTDVTLKETPGKLVKAKGGKNQPASEDALKAAKLRQVAKKSTTDALSTQELQTLVSRMNLEQQYDNLSKNGTRDSTGKKVVRTFLSDPKNKELTLESIGKGAVKATAAAGGGKAAVVGVQIGAAIARGVVQGASKNKKK